MGRHPERHGDAAGHDGRHPHPHVHGLVDPAVASTARGLWAAKWSFAGLLATAVLQLGVVLVSGSVALLADTIHNFADAGTALPLWVAFACARLLPTRRFPHGYGRVEDLAGVAIVLTILFSALAAGYQAVVRLVEPQPVAHVGAVAVAALVGFLGNEGVAVFRIRVGREIGSAALVADGYHARADGLTSLAVLASVAGVAGGLPLADPLVGLAITVVILALVWQAARPVVTRLLDGVDPRVLEEARHAAAHVPGVQGVAEVRARWAGHRLLIEMNVAVAAGLTVAAGHQIAKEVRHQILHHLPHASGVVVHVDPTTEPGETHHRVASHAHDGLAAHGHG
jgi:cation diffusion facilitator family transporter